MFSAALAMLECGCSAPCAAAPQVPKTPSAEVTFTTKRPLGPLGLNNFGTSACNKMNGAAALTAKTSNNSRGAMPEVEARGANDEVQDVAGLKSSCSLWASAPPSGKKAANAAASPSSPGKRGNIDNAADRNAGSTAASTGLMLRISRASVSPAILIAAGGAGPLAMAQGSSPMLRRGLHAANKPSKPLKYASRSCSKSGA
mmetsp:Transcript_101839/g.285448  ORF Transcript_101839/g.285448 Transcript_101839/m.285448 type:complete len:201 (+) Transcript_101839:253-855(+)